MTVHTHIFLRTFNVKRRNYSKINTENMLHTWVKRFSSNKCFTTHQEDDGILVLRRTAVYSHVILPSSRFLIRHHAFDGHRRPKNIEISHRERDYMVSLNSDPTVREIQSCLSEISSAELAFF